jgi:hypothetical protein
MAARRRSAVSAILVADLIAEQDRPLSISEIGLIRSAAALLVRSEE